MKKFVEVRQRGYKDCATACLLSIIKYYGGDVSYEELNILLRVDKNGTSAYNILDAAKSLGFDGYGSKCDADNIFDYHEFFPLIIHTLSNNYYHFMVLYSVNKDTFILMDPSKGIVKLNYKEFKKIFLETILVIYPGKMIPNCKNVNTFGKYIVSLLFSFKKNIINIIVLSIVIVVVSMIYNLYFKVLLDYNLNSNKLFILSLFFINILFIKNVMSFIRNRCLIKFNKDISNKINDDIVSKIFNLPYIFFKNKSTGEVVYRINDLSNFRNLISEVVSEIFLDIIMILCSISVMYSISNKLFLIVLVFSVCYFGIEYVYKNTFRKSISEYKNSSSYYNEKLVEAINGYESIKNINMLSTICDNLDDLHLNITSKYERFNNYLSNQLFIKNISVDLFYLVIMSLGSYLLGNSISDLILFLTILGFYVEPLKNVFSIIPRFYEGKYMYQRINDMLMIEGNISDSSIYKLCGDISIRELTYSYNGIDYVFNNINLDIKYGTDILIFGKSGIGKSTLFKIMLKYLNNYQGKVIINNNDLSYVSDEIIFNSFTYVSQHEYLLNDSIKNNILFYRDISDEEYSNVIKICMLTDFISSKRFGDNQFIEDNGFNISGGEKQKLILARALLKESNYIILDEALSEISFEEEKVILNNIKKYYSNKTIIYSSHKEEMINEFEKIYYIERRG